MDGKTGAEELLAKLAQDESCLAARPWPRRQEALRRLSDREARCASLPITTGEYEAWSDPQASALPCQGRWRAEGSDFASLLLKREFKPKSDRRHVDAVVTSRAKRWRNRRCPRPSWSAAMSWQIDRGHDRRSSTRSCPSRSIKIMHHAELPEAGKRMARSALSRQQHRNRRDAEDPCDEHLQVGASQDLKKLQGHRLGSKPHLQAQSMKKNTVSSVASPSAVWWATIISTTPRRMSSAWAKWPRSPPRHTPHSLQRPARH
jgi:hypothetical protein